MGLRARRFWVEAGIEVDPKGELNFGRREQCPLGKPRPRAGKQAVNMEAYWPWV